MWLLQAKEIQPSIQLHVPILLLTRKLGGLVLSCLRSICKYQEMEAEILIYCFIFTFWSQALVFCVEQKLILVIIWSKLLVRAFPVLLVLSIHTFILLTTLILWFYWVVVALLRNRIIWPELYNVTFYIGELATVCKINNFLSIAGS